MCLTLKFADHCALPTSFLPDVASRLSADISKLACTAQVSSIMMDPSSLGKILIEVRVVPTSFDDQEFSDSIPHRVIVSAPGWPSSRSSSRSEDRRVHHHHSSSRRDRNHRSDEGSACSCSVAVVGVRSLANCVFFQNGFALLGSTRSIMLVAVRHLLLRLSLGLMWKERLLPVGEANIRFTGLLLRLLSLGMTLPCRLLLTSHPSRLRDTQVSFSSGAFLRRCPYLKFEAHVSCCPQLRPLCLLLLPRGRFIILVLFVTSSTAGWGRRLLLVIFPRLSLPFLRHLRSLMTSLRELTLPCCMAALGLVMRGCRRRPLVKGQLPPGLLLPLLQPLDHVLQRVLPLPQVLFLLQGSCSSSLWARLATTVMLQFVPSTLCCFVLPGGPVSLFYVCYPFFNKGGPKKTSDALEIVCVLRKCFGVE